MHDVENSLSWHPLWSTLDNYLCGMRIIFGQYTDHAIQSKLKIIFRCYLGANSGPSWITQNHIPISVTIVIMNHNAPKHQDFHALYCSFVRVQELFGSDSLLNKCMYYSVDNLNSGDLVQTSMWIHNECAHLLARFVWRSRCEITEFYRALLETFTHKSFLPTSADTLATMVTVDVIKTLMHNTTLVVFLWIHLSENLCVCGCTVVINAHTTTCAECMVWEDWWYIYLPYYELWYGVSKIYWIINLRFPSWTGSCETPLILTSCQANTVHAACTGRTPWSWARDVIPPDA